MTDTPITPVPLKKLVKSVVLDRGGYIFGGMGLISIMLSPAAAIFLLREADEQAALLVAGLLGLFGALCMYTSRVARQTSQRLLDEFVSRHDCDCDLCGFIKRTPNRPWFKRDSDHPKP